MQQCTVVVAAARRRTYLIVQERLYKGLSGTRGSTCFTLVGTYGIEGVDGTRTYRSWE